MARPVDNVTRRGDRAAIYRGFTHSFALESHEHRRNRPHCTELAWILRLAVGGGLSRWPLDRQRWQLIPLEILGGEQEDIVGLCQLPGAIREVRRVAQHRHCTRTECEQTQPNDGFFADWASRPVFAFGDDIIIWAVTKLLAAGDDVGFQAMMSSRRSVMYPHSSRASASCCSSHSPLPWPRPGVSFLSTSSSSGLLIVGLLVRLRVFVCRCECEGQWYGLGPNSVPCRRCVRRLDAIIACGRWLKGERSCRAIGGRPLDGEVVDCD